MSLEGLFSAVIEAVQGVLMDAFISFITELLGQFLHVTP